jgi:hypothetical protein
MKHNNEMALLRAARPAEPSPANDLDARFAQIVAEPGDPRLTSSATIQSARSARRWMARPRIVAGGSLGLAGVATGLVLAFNGSTATPAFAITTSGDGSLLVHVYHVSAMKAAVQQLDATHLQGMLDVAIQRGPATVPGPLKCSTEDQGQQVEMLLGSNGTDVVPAGVRGAGAWHLAQCSITPSNRGSNGITLPGSTTGTTTYKRWRRAASGSTGPLQTSKAGV